VEREYLRLNYVTPLLLNLLPPPTPPKTNQTKPQVANSEETTLSQQQYVSTPESNYDNADSSRLPTSLSVFLINNF
jgi:hypothetical protein